MNNPYQAPFSSNERIHVSGKMEPCKGCGKELHITASFCPSCGASQRQGRYKSKTLATILAFFFGGFGIHRFYLGQWWGIFYLLFFWLWIPAIIALIECIVFLATDQRNWDDKYNEGKPAGPYEGRSHTLMFVVVGVFAFVIIVGILAAVALPAYQDYSVRVQVAEALVETSMVRQKANEYFMQQGTLPPNNQSLNLPQPWILSKGHEVIVSPQGIALRFSGTRILEGKTLYLSPVLQQGSLDWDCRGGTLEPKYRPKNCR
jgi:TM2 domain-containing membrane protein YozV/Tfp pilus assembly protein PilE